VKTKSCYACEKEVVSKNVIGLNKKLLGRKIVKFYCLDCLAEHFEVTIEELIAKVEDFKSQGCTLFQ
jgi:hypothetical protein